MKFSTPSHLFYERHEIQCIQHPSICSTSKATSTVVHNQLLLSEKGSGLAICTGSTILCLYSRIVSIFDLTADFENYDSSFFLFPNPPYEKGIKKLACLQRIF